MKDIYQRLKALRIDANFVRSRILPDWWEDDLAAVPANRSVAEFAIGRYFGIPVAALRDPDAALSLPLNHQAMLKLRGKATREDVAPGLALADRVGHLVVDLLRDAGRLPPFAGTQSAAAIRSAILQDGSLVTFQSLLRYAWTQGIAIVHLAEVPAGSSFHGMASFVGDVPVVVLASAIESPPWLAFHLAHELGHVMLRHVHSGSGPLVDGGGDRAASDDEQELEADAFAMRMLRGGAPPPLPRNSPIGKNLAGWAKKLSEKARIDPGTLALIFGRERDRIPVAQSALKLLGLDKGARGVAAEQLAEFAPDGVPEDLWRLMAPQPATA